MASASVDSQVEQVPQHLIFIVGRVCTNEISVAEVYRRFLHSGANPEWWTQPQRPDGSARFNQLLGWIEGIRIHAPEKEVEVFRQFVMLIISGRAHDCPVRLSLEDVIAELDGVSKISAKSLERFNLHPKVIAAASKLFKDGHYRQAVLDTYIALNTEVQVKSGRSDLDGTTLMQHVFSIKDPVLVLSDDKNEQLGIMNLFAGAILAIRNPRAHNLNDNDPKTIDETLELLGFASFLFRQLDRAQLEVPPDY